MCQLPPSPPDIMPGRLVTTSLPVTTQTGGTFEDPLFALSNPGPGGRAGSGQHLRGRLRTATYAHAHAHQDAQADLHGYAGKDAHTQNAQSTGPADGPAATAELLAGARALLEPRGLLALEIDERRGAAVQALGEAAGLSVSILEDLFGKPRYALAVPKGEE